MFCLFYCGDGGIEPPSKRKISQFYKRSLSVFGSEYRIKTDKSSIPSSLFLFEDYARQHNPLL